MKLLLDQGLPRSAARKEGRAVVTLDADFHTLLALSGAAQPSVVRIRIEGLQAEALARIIRTVLDHCEADLSKGAAVTITEDDIRIHHLPVRRR